MADPIDLTLNVQRIRQIAERAATRADLPAEVKSALDEIVGLATIRAHDTIEPSDPLHTENQSL